MNKPIEIYVPFQFTSNSWVSFDVSTPRDAALFVLLLDILDAADNQDGWMNAKWKADVKRLFDAVSGTPSAIAAYSIMLSMGTSVAVRTKFVHDVMVWSLLDVFYEDFACTRARPKNWYVSHVVRDRALVLASTEALNAQSFRDELRKLLVEASTNARAASENGKET